MLSKNQHSRCLHLLPITELLMLLMLPLLLVFFCLCYETNRMEMMVLLSMSVKMMMTPICNCNDAGDYDVVDLER